MPRDAHPCSDEELFAAYRHHQDRRQLAVLFRRRAAELLQLAVFLAPRASVAEDLVQATFLTAITNAHTFRDDGRVMSWLCGILANHARMACRDARRVLPERALAATTDAEPIDAMEHAELRSHLDRCIARLPEPYHTVMRLHLDEGLESGEIARRLARPRATVRKQTERALARLRLTLPMGLAMGLVVRLSPGQIVREVMESTQAATPTAPVGVARGAAVKLRYSLVAVAAAAVALVAIAVRPDVASGGEGIESTAPIPPAAAVAVGAPAGRSVADLGEATSAAREPAVVAARLQLVAVDPTGAPRRDVKLLLVAADPGPIVERLGAASTRSARTDAGGVATFSELTPGRYQVALPGSLVTQTLVLGAGPNESKLVLPLPSRLSGFVRDPRGNPVDGAAIVVSESAGRGDLGAVVAYSDTAGFYQATTDVGNGRVYARHDDYSVSTSVVLQRDLSADLVVEPSDRTIDVTVVDAAGILVVDGYVALAPRGGRSDHLLVAHGRTDDQGRCVLKDPGSREAALVVSAAGKAAVVVDLPIDESSLTIRLPAAAEVVGTVVDDAGAPMAGVCVSAAIATVRSNEPVSPLTTRVARSGPDGTFRLTRLPVGQKVRLAVRAPARAASTQRYHNQILLAGCAVTLTPGEVRKLRLSVCQREPLVGRLRRPDGGSLVGWHVVAVPAEGLVMSRIGRARSGRSQADGSVTIPDVVDDEDYVLGLFPPDTPQNEGRIHPLVTRRVDPSDAFEVVFDPDAVRIASLSCRVLVPGGRAAAGVTLSLRREDFQQPMSLETGGDGGCTFGALSPGAYLLTVRSRLYGDHTVRVTMPNDGADVDLGVINLAMPSLPRVRVCVDRRLYPSGLRVVLRHGAGSFTAARTNAAGWATLRAVPPGEAELLVHGPGVAPVSRTVQLETGHRTIEVDVDAAPLVCLEIPFEPVQNPYIIDGPLGFEVYRDGELVFRDSIGRAAEPGVFRMRTGLVAGSYSIRATSIWNAIGSHEFVVRAGVANGVRVPLILGGDSCARRAGESIVLGGR